MKNCYLCNVELNEFNKSLEHIIPNGIGGRLKSYDLLCSKCNNQLSKFDEEVCLDLTFFTNFLNPKRDHGKNPKATFKNEDGLDVIRTPDNDLFAKPQIKINKEENGKINFSYHTFYNPSDENREKAITQIINLVKPIAKKYKWNDEKYNEEIDKLKQVFSQNIKESEGPILKHATQFNKNGQLFLGLLKLTLNFYIYQKLPNEHIMPLKHLLRTGNIEEINKISNLFYPESFYNNSSIFHTIVLKTSLIRIN